MDLPQLANAAVDDWFDSTSAWLATLPSGPLNELASEALLLVRRSLFNQLPTADPYQFLTRANGQLVGTVGVVDPEGDAVTYNLTQAPAFGTVQIAPDGTYTYTPGIGYPDGDAFTVAVRTNGFNVLNPFANRTTEVTVQVPDPSPVGTNVGVSRGFDIVNFTTFSLKLTDVLKEKGYEDYFEYVPVVGTVLNPGDSVHIEAIPYLFSWHDARFLFSACVQPSCQGGQYASADWIVKARTDQSDSSITAERGNFTYDTSQAKDTPRKILLVNPPGTFDIYPSTPGAVSILSGLLAANDRLPSSNLKLVFVNAVFADVTPKPTDYQRILNLDNPSDNSKSSGTQIISTQFSKTRGSSWEVSGAVKWTLIDKILDATVSAKYAVSTSATESRTYTTQITQGLPAWSANEVLAVAPQLNVSGDVTIGFGQCPTFKCPTFGFPDVGATYVFHNIDYVYPQLSKAVDKPLYIIRTEPLQPNNADGAPTPNLGFMIKDKASPLLNPTYAVGDVVQLTATAYNGLGSDTADFSRRATYTSSNPSVATVDPSGAVTTLAAGTTEITARYDWSIPLGDGVTRLGHVLATIDITVKK